MKLEEIIDQDTAYMIASGEIDLFDSVYYEKLFDYYVSTGEMPYGVAKARDGDPDQWIVDRLYHDLHLFN